MAHATMTYEEILRQVRQLELVEQANLLAELAKLVKEHVAPRPRRSIMELEGLGAEIWEGIDAQEYVDRERGKWPRE